MRARLRRRAELRRVQSGCLAAQGRWRAACPVVRHCEAEGGAAVRPGGGGGGHSHASAPGRAKQRLGKAVARAPPVAW